MQVRGGKEMTLTPGQTFYEGPDEIHVVGRNASQTKPVEIRGVLREGQRRSGAGAGQLDYGPRAFLLVKTEHYV